MSVRIRQAALLAVVFLSLPTLVPLPTFAQELEFKGSIVEHQPSYLLVSTSGNETLRFELAWFKNTDGYALNRDESYCFDIEQLPDGKLMLVSVVDCQEQVRRRRASEDRDRNSGGS
jgi:hypothetical protein